VSTTLPDPPQESARPLAPPAIEGRRFTGSRKVRLGDVDGTGRLRLDALTRYTQDVSDDDTTDAGLPADPGWVVRSTVVDELVPAALAEHLTFVTFCSGIGRTWAERRLSISGDGGARYEVATVWICVNPTTGAPSSLTDQFMELYGPAAAGRKVSARLTNPKPPSDPAGLSTEQWSLRAADYDVYNHVNNAAYWAVVEQRLDSLPPVPRRSRMEYGRGIEPTASVPIAQSGGRESGSLVLWWLGDEDDAPPAASSATVPVDPTLYAD
jgi:acyl-ACP thioesterase